MEPESESGTLLASQHAGSDRWWLDIARRGTPWIESTGRGNWKVTFFWRDPQGSEFSSAYQRVWINITGKTDHHQPNPPRSLQRLSGTDVWFWQTEMEAGWRGSYSFMPSTESRSFSPQDDDPRANMMALRHWWRDRFKTATSDLLNARRSWSGGRGHPCPGCICRMHRRNLPGVISTTSPPVAACARLRRPPSYKNTSGIARALATAAPSGFTPPVKTIRRRVRWLSCSTASFGPSRCRSGNRCIS